MHHLLPLLLLWCERSSHTPYCSLTALHIVVTTTQDARTISTVSRGRNLIDELILKSLLDVGWRILWINECGGTLQRIYIRQPIREYEPPLERHITAARRRAGNHYGFLSNPTLPYCWTLGPRLEHDRCPHYIYILPCHLCTWEDFSIEIQNTETENSFAYTYWWISAHFHDSVVASNSFGSRVVADCFKRKWCHERTWRQDLTRYLFRYYEVVTCLNKARDSKGRCYTRLQFLRWGLLAD